MTVYFIRHGQSTFNVAFNNSGIDPQIIDAPLTPQGQREAKRLGESLAGLRFDHVFTSPLTRALQTARLAFSGHKVTVLRLIREGRFSSCDIGSAAGQLAHRFPDMDFSGLPPRWWWEGDEPDGFRENEESLLGRVGRFKELISAHSGRIIAVVGHGAFFHRLTGRNLDNCEFVKWDL